MKNAGWETFTDEKTAAKYIFDTGEYKGFLPQDDDILNKFIPDKCNLKILDFCCGIGRNTIWVPENRPDCRVCGYDLENMIILAKAYSERHLGDHEIEYLDDFEKLKEMEFDLVFSTLALQHILIEHLENYYPFLQKSLINSKYGLLFVHGRDWSDHNDREIVWERLQKYFELVPDHILSDGFEKAVFTKEFIPSDHHMSVFKPRKQ